MAVWWEGLTTLEQVLYCIAIPSTLVLLIQTVMTLCGFDHNGAGVNVSDVSGIDFDTDFSADTGVDLDLSNGDPVSDLGSMHFFTVQGMVAFLCIFGWSSIIILHGGGGSTMSLLCGMVFGFIAMYSVAKIMQLTGKMTQSGTINMHNALGETGRVYLTIPARGNGMGKVNITMQGNFMEFDAISISEESIKTGENIRVIDIEGDCLVVEKD